MLATLREQEPDAETGAWLPLSLRRLNQHLLDQGQDSNPETLRNLLASLARDGRGLAGGERGSLEFRQTDRDHYRIKLHRDWPALAATAGAPPSGGRRGPANPAGQGPAGDQPRARRCLVAFGTDELTRSPARGPGPERGTRSTWPPSSGGSCSSTNKALSSCSAAWPYSVRP